MTDWSCLQVCSTYCWFEGFNVEASPFAWPSLLPLEGRASQQSRSTLAPYLDINFDLVPLASCVHGMQVLCMMGMYHHGDSIGWGRGGLQRYSVCMLHLGTMQMIVA